MTDKLLKKAFYLLREGVTSREVAAICGLSVERCEQLQRVSQNQRKNAEGLSLREALREDLVKRLSADLHELLEYGYEPQEAADYLAGLLDAISGVQEAAVREQRFRVAP